MVECNITSVPIIDLSWEIRQINPELPSAQSIESLLGEHKGPQRIEYVLNASQSHPAGGGITHSAFVLSWSDGKRFLLDVGMDRAGTEEFGRMSETIFGSDPIEFHGTIAELLGDTASTISGLAFTHLHQDHTVLQDLGDDPHVYFTHSYAYRNPAARDIAATTEYGETIIAAVARDNIFATQFHPEKSQRTGLQILSNFVLWNPK